MRRFPEPIHAFQTKQSKTNNSIKFQHYTEQTIIETKHSHLIREPSHGIFTIR